MFPARLSAVRREIRSWRRSRPAAISDLGFEPATVIRLQPDAAGGGRLMVARLGENRHIAHPVVEFDAAAGTWFTIPLGLLERTGGGPLQFALVVARDGRELEVVPPLGSLGLRVPRRPFPEAAQVPHQKVLVASAEIVPFAKSGGPADVVAALAKELRREGHDVRLVMPRYRQVTPEHYDLVPVLQGLKVPLGNSIIEASVLEGRSGEVPVYFIDCPQLYDRDALYGFGDDDARFIFFSRALLEMLRPLGFIPDVIHLHDWHVALVPNLLEKQYAQDPELSSIGTVLTVHNIAFQGQFGSGAVHLAGLENWGLIRVGVPQLDDVVNLLGRGIQLRRRRDHGQRAVRPGDPNPRVRGGHGGALDVPCAQALRDRQRYRHRPLRPVPRSSDRSSILGRRSWWQGPRSGSPPL